MYIFLKLFDYSSLGVYQFIISFSTSGVYRLSSTSRVSTFYVQAGQTKDEEEQDEQEEQWEEEEKEELEEDGDEEEEQ